MAADSPGAVVVGGHVNGLTVARALAQARVSVAVVRTRAYDIAHCSRSVALSVRLEEFPRRNESLLELLEARRNAWRNWTVYPTDDLALSLLLAHRETLERWGYRTVAPPEDAARTLLEKDRTLALARKLGVDTPIDYGEAQSPKIEPQRLSWPVLLKPDESHLFREAFPGKKAFLSHDAQEFAEHRRKLAKAVIRASVLDFIPGPDAAFFNYSVYRTTDGEFLGGFPMRKLRKTPPFFGVCRVAHTDVSPELAQAMRESVEAMLAAIDYRGMANAEFKLDPRDGRLRLMEINARPFLMQGLPMRTGIAYARMAWQDVALSERPTFEDNGWRGAWIHLHADIGNALAYRRQEALPFTEYLRPYRMPHTWAVWSAVDPKPFILQWSRTAFLRPFSS